MDSIKNLFDWGGGKIAGLSLWFVDILSNHSLAIIITPIIIIHIINLISLNRYPSQDGGFIDIIFSIIFIYLFYHLVYTDNFTSIFNDYFFTIYKICEKSFPRKCSIIHFKAGIFEISLITYIIFLVAIDSRLMWVLSIASFEFYFVINNELIIYSLFSKIPVKHRYLFHGIMPFLLASPLMLAIWIFRDNDKHQDMSNKRKELDLKSKELAIREKELSIRDSELKIKYEETQLAKNRKT